MRVIIRCFLDFGLFLKEELNKFCKYNSILIGHPTRKHIPHLFSFPKIESNDDVYIVPAFTGLGAPYWDSEARALICGMSEGTKKNHLGRAALESIAYQVKDIIECMTKDTNLVPKELRADGGLNPKSFPNAISGSNKQKKSFLYNSLILGLQSESQPFN